MYLVRFANVYLTAGIRKKSKKECARKKLKKENQIHILANLRKLQKKSGKDI